MKYDIAAKVVIDISKETILRRFLGLDLDSIEFIEELQEETYSLMRSDFPLHVVLKDGEELIVLIEIQTDFNQDFVLRLIAYTARFRLKYHLKVIPMVLLLKPSRHATGFYKDAVLSINYNVLRFWEEQAKDFMDDIVLYPFLPLMAGGESVIEEAEKRIYESKSLNMEEKADLLTTMAIFAGLRNSELAIKLIERRRDIMIRSAAYDIIKEEGKKEGLEEGLRRGEHNAIALGLELKFGTEGLELMERILRIESLEKLGLIKEAVKIANKLDEVERLVR